MNTLDQIDLRGKRVIMRVDFNVPLDKSLNVSDTKRIEETLPSIKKILGSGCALILISHLGRPQKKLKAGESTDSLTLRPVMHALKKILDEKGVLYHSVNFFPFSRGMEVKEKCETLQAGDILLLENLRFHKEEESGDRVFAGELASLAEIYVNDAFGTAHRAHASTAIIGEYAKAKACGYLMQKEIESADCILKNAKKPFVAVLGGAKVSDKILLIEQLLPKVDMILIGGAMAYTFLKSAGKNTGNSLCENDKLDTARSVLKLAKEKNVQLILPPDSVVGNRFSEDAEVKICSSENIPAGWMGLDIGPQTVAAYAGYINSAKTILWNGPMGVFEMKPFSQGTFRIAEKIISASNKGTYVLVGGGDSASAVKKSGLATHASQEYFFVSTGGGALLEYIEGKTLPGIAALG